MMRRFFESFLPKKQDDTTNKIDIFTEANIFTSQEIRDLQNKINAVSISLNTEYDTYKPIQEEILKAQDDQTYSLEISVTSKEIATLRERQAENQRAIETREDTLNITQKSAEIDRLSLDCLALQNALLVATTALLSTVPSQNTTKWGKELISWTNNLLERPPTDQEVQTIQAEIISINKKIEELDKIIEEKTKLDSEHTLKSKELTAIETRIAEIEYLRVERAAATGLWILLNLIIACYFILVGDPLSEKIKKKETLVQEKTQLTTALADLSDRKKLLDEDTQKLIPLKQQFELINTHMIINKLKLQVTELKNDVSLKTLLSEKEELCAEESRLDQQMAKLQNDSDKLEARETSSEQSKYAEEIRLLESLNENLNLLNIYVTSSNISVAHDKYENILRLLDEIKPKMQGSFSFKQQANSLGINLEKIEKIVTIQQKILISGVLEKYLQNIGTQKALVSKDAKKEYQRLEKAIQKYQSLILLPNPNRDKTEESCRSAADALKVIERKRASLPIVFGADFEQAINAGNNIIGINDTPDNAFYPK